MFKEFDFKKFRGDVETLLAPLAKEHGISITAGTVVYDQGGFRLTLGAEKPNDMKEKCAFISQCREYDFEPRDYKRKILVDGVEYLFVGFNDDNLKPCNVLNLSNNKIYRASETMVEEHFLDSSKPAENDNPVSIFDV